MKKPVELYRFMLEFQRSHPGSALAARYGFPPRVTEIALALGVQNSAVLYSLHWLQGHSAVVRMPGPEMVWNGRDVRLARSAGLFFAVPGHDDEAFPPRARDVYRFMIERQQQSLENKDPRTIYGVPPTLVECAWAMQVSRQRIHQCMRALLFVEIVTVVYGASTRKYVAIPVEEWLSCHDTQSTQEQPKPPRLYAQR